jgi:multidrug resistance efflux pump
MTPFSWMQGWYLSAGLAAPEPAARAPLPHEPGRLVPVPGAPKKPRGAPLLVALLLLLAVAATVWTVRRRQAAQQATAGLGLRTAKAFVGPFERSLRIAGSIGASNYAAIVAPQLRGRENNATGGDSTPSQLILLKLAPPGTYVKKGGTVALFDNQWEIQHLDDHKAQLVQAKATVARRKAEIAFENQTEDQLVHSAKADWDKAKLDLRTVEIRSAIDAEKLKLAAEEAEAHYQQLQEEARLKILSQTAEVRTLEMQVEIQQNHIDRHTHNLQRLNMKSPIDGLVVMQPIWRSGQFGQVQEGDQVYPGSYFMQIVDLSKMVVNGHVNQADSQGLLLGQKAVIHLDAYPDVAFPARLVSLGAMAASSPGFGRGRAQYVKWISVRFAIDAKDTRLIPDLSAAADVIIKAEPKALQVPREAVIEDHG